MFFPIWLTVYVERPIPRVTAAGTSIGWYPLTGSVLSCRLWLHLVPWRLPWGPCAAPAHPWRWRALPTCIPRLPHVTAAPLGACSVRCDCVFPVIADPLSVRIIVKKTRGADYSRRTLSPRPTAAGPAAERRAINTSSARLLLDCTPAACAIPIPAPILGRIFALCASGKFLLVLLNGWGYAECF